MSYDLEGLKVLLVDDSLQMRALVSRLLLALGIGSVELAQSGKHAIAMNENFRPDIVITDWLMEPMDGIELTRYLRNDKNSPDPFIPIIMMTGHAEVERVMEARDAGVTEFLVKPLSAKSLCDRIVSVIEKPRPFIRTKTFFGPCRRRQGWTGYTGPERRKGSKGAETTDARQRGADREQMINELLRG